MAKQVLNPEMLKSKKEPYSGTAKAETVNAVKAKAHDMRIPFVRLMEFIMEDYLKSGKVYPSGKK